MCIRMTRYTKNQVWTNKLWLRPADDCNGSGGGGGGPPSFRMEKPEEKLKPKECSLIKK